jgi:hypothetical protein
MLETDANVGMVEAVAQFMLCCDAKADVDDGNAVQTTTMPTSETNQSGKAACDKTRTNPGENQSLRRQMRRGKTGDAGYR